MARGWAVREVRCRLTKKSIWGCIVGLCTGIWFVTTPGVAGQQNDIFTLLQQLQSTDVETRMDAFHTLETIGVGSNDQIKLGIIGLLTTEENALQGGSVVDTSDERYGSYFLDVVNDVANVHDSRALNPLLGAIQTGALAMNGLATFGASALDGIIALTHDGHVLTRAAAVRTLSLMLDPQYLPGVADQTSKTRIRVALNAASLDANGIVANLANQAIQHLNQVDIAGDLNGDLLVNCLDLAIVKASFGKRTGQPGFDVRADVNRDGLVDVRDLAVVSQKLASGTKCP
jgi:hypothetical protein